MFDIFSPDDSDNLFAGLPEEFFPVFEEEFLPPDPVFSAEDLATLAAWQKAAAVRPEGTRPFDLSQHRHLIELYNEPRDRLWSRVVVMKAAQMALTIRLLNRAMWLCSDTRQAINTGLIFPSQNAVEDLSASRFRPMLQSSAAMQKLVRGMGKKSSQVDKVNLVRIAISNMRFRGMRSGIGMDSFPADALLFDEVRLMENSKVERVFIRVSESLVRDPHTGTRGLLELNSTAGLPDSDIHLWFTLSTQGYWRSRCPDIKCTMHQEGIVLPTEFAQEPARVVGRTNTGRYYLRCPRCGARIPDPQDGFYRHENPDAEWRGYQFSQLLKGEDYLNTQIMPAWDRGQNIPEFYNSILGLPFMDADGVPVTEATLIDCMDRTGSFFWDSPRVPLGFNGEWRCMGIDQRGPEKHVIIKTRLANGKFRTDYIGVIELAGQECAQEIARLFEAWGCKLLVMDGEPSYDLLVDVAELIGKTRVYAADYNDKQTNIFEWEDSHNDKKIKKSTGKVKHEYRCLIHRFKGIERSLNNFRYGVNILPTRASFMRYVTLRTIGGKKQPHLIYKEYVAHITNYARLRVADTHTMPDGQKIIKIGSYTSIWKRRKTEIDPHFLHANLYADAGLAFVERDVQTGVVDATPQQEQQQPTSHIPLAMQPEALQEVQRQLAQVCGSCQFKQGPYCKHPQTGGAKVRVDENTPSCNMFSPLEH